MPVLILGAGGHARVVLDALMCMGVPIMGYSDLKRATVGKFSKLTYIGDDDALECLDVTSMLLVNGLGSVSSVDHRARLFERYKALGFLFASVIHPLAILARDVRLGEGCQIMAGAVIQPGVQCGDNVIINTSSSVDHDSNVGTHTHISTGVTVSGEVKIGEKVHVGAGSTIIQGVSIGHRCLVAAGAVVIRDVEDDERVAGVPAHRMVI